MQLCNNSMYGICCIRASAPLRDLPPATRHFRTWIPLASRGARPDHVWWSRCGAVGRLVGAGNDVKKRRHVVASAQVGNTYSPVVAGLLGTSGGPLGRGFWASVRFSWELPGALLACLGLSWGALGLCYPSLPPPPIPRFPPPLPLFLSSASSNHGRRRDQLPSGWRCAAVRQGRDIIV